MFIKRNLILNILLFKNSLYFFCLKMVVLVRDDCGGELVGIKVSEGNI